jgi:hypothetical protein
LIFITQNGPHHPARRAILSPVINIIHTYKDSLHKTFGKVSEGAGIKTKRQTLKENNIHMKHKITM